jgi:hypothetical protein
MARSWKTKGSRVNYSKEKQWARKQTQRFYRARVAQLLRKERWDDIAPKKRTGGWVTW